MNRNWIVEPRHGFFAKDARGWFAGAGNQGNSLPWLHPTTLRGAICSAIGRELEQQESRMFNPAQWLELKASVTLRHALAVRAPVGQPFSLAHRMWRAPADAIHLQGRTTPDRLVAKPADVEIWDRYDDPRTRALQLLTLDGAAGDADAKPQRGPIWWTEAEFVDWLCGLRNTGPSASLAIGRQPHGRTDVHVKMSNDTETAEQGFLWANEFREALTTGHRDDVTDQNLTVRGRYSVYRWAFAVTIQIARDDAGGIHPETAVLAGDRHLASIISSEELAPFPAKYHAALQDNPRLQRLRLFATCPTIFRNGWCPDGFSMQDGDLVGTLPGIDFEVRLVAAAVGRPVPISGWDLAARATESDESPPNGPRQASGAPRVTQLACPAGSMWLVERLDSQPFAESDVQKLWLAAWGQGTADGLGGLIAGLDPNC